MLRYLFFTAMFIHGLIHLTGFVMAFGYGGLNLTTNHISRANGILWLIAGFLFILASILFLIKHDAWLLATILAGIASQVLIFMFWSDAKFGTLANVIIVTIAIIIAASREMKYIFRD